VLRRSFTIWGSPFEKHENLAECVEDAKRSGYSARRLAICTSSHCNLVKETQNLDGLSPKESLQRGECSQSVNTEPKKSPLRYLRVLTYFIPIFAIIAGYGVIVLVTQESSPFTIVTGTSMQPTILPGSIALIAKVPFNQLKVGDVIVHTTQDAKLAPCDQSPASTLTGEVANPCFVIHRIVSIQTNASGDKIITTKGDDNTISIGGIDTGIDQSMYLGKVILQFPLLGYLTEQPYNEIIALFIFIALIAELLFERNQMSTTKTTSIPQ